MFLSKKTALNKPKPQDKPKRLLGGWNDEEEGPTLPPKQPNTQPSINLLEGTADSPSKPAVTAPSPVSHSQYQDWDTLNDRADIEIEKGLVEEIVKATGIRIKQTDSALGDFLKEVRFLEVGVVGSLLLSKLEVNYPFALKAKALYAIEHLARKSQDHLLFFRAHASKLANFPEPEDNPDNYRKILRAVMNAIGVPIATQEEKLQFVDPGYGEEPHPKSALGSFIQENGKAKKSEVVRGLVGPGQPGGKAKKEADLLEFDFAAQPTSQSGVRPAEESLV